MRISKFALAVLTIAAASAAAEAGTITGASGPFKLNGKDSAVETGKTLATKKGDVIDTLGASVAYRSDTGDTISVDPGSLVREEETNELSAALFVLRGSATGMLTEKTQLGVAAGWATAPKGMKSKVLVEATAGKENSEALFRAVEGSAGVKYWDFEVSLTQAHSVTVDIDPAAHGTFCFRTGQQNAGEIEVRKRVPGGDIVAFVPKATLGCFTDEQASKTKICNDINSLKTAKIRLQTRFVGKGENTAAIGPGTCALIDNATGAIEVLFSAVKFEILERALSLTTEFSTLAQSNFSDVK